MRGGVRNTARLCLVVDLRIVAGLRTYRKHEKGWQSTVQTPLGPQAMGNSNAKTDYDEDIPAPDVKVVFSYSVREYILTSDGPTRYSVRVNGG
jgi:hypothetical protein